MIYVGKYAIKERIIEIDILFLKQRKEKSFMKKNLFICLTPLNFYFSYYIATVLYEKDCSESVILLKGAYHSNAKSNKNYISTKYIKNENLLEKMRCRIYYDLLWNMSDISKHINKFLNRLFVFNLNDYVSKHAVKNAKMYSEIIYVEEGIGSWAGNWSGCSGLEKIDTALIGEPDAFRRTHLEFHGNIIPLFYTDVFNRDSTYDYCNMMLQEDKISSRGEIDFLYLGFVDGEGIDYNDEFKVLELIIKRIPKNKLLYIKKHPRDNSGKYNFWVNNYKNVKIIDEKWKEIPVECLAWNYDVKYVLSILSSAGFYLPKIKENLKSIFLYKVESICSLHFEDLKEKDYVAFEKMIAESENIFCPLHKNEINYIFES